MGVEFIDCMQVQWQQKEKEEIKRGREKKVSDNTHIHNLQQGGAEETLE